MSLIPKESKRNSKFSCFLRIRNKQKYYTDKQFYYSAATLRNLQVILFRTISQSMLFSLLSSFCKLNLSYCVKTKNVLSFWWQQTPCTTTLRLSIHALNLIRLNVYLYVSLQICKSRRQCENRSKRITNKRLNYRQKLSKKVCKGSENPIQADRLTSNWNMILKTKNLCGSDKYWTNWTKIGLDATKILHPNLKLCGSDNCL